MYYDFIQENKRKLLVAVVMFFVVIIAWAVLIYVGRIGKVPVVIAVVPHNATVTLDGSRYGAGAQWLTPGEYTVVAKNDGFETVTRDVRISEQKEQNVVALSLLPKSKEAKEWAKTHDADYLRIQEFATIEANVNGEYFSKLNPITKKLPFTDPYFKIGYITNDDLSITLTIETPSPRYRFYALEHIREIGFEPTDYRIDFEDFKNPLEKK